MERMGQIRTCLRSGEYSRALDLLRASSSEFPHDAELAELEKLAQDGINRKTEADRLITESQELFAQQKSADAIQLLRKAYELDKRNSLARAILANALVEHAHSIVETDWLEAETLTNQALNLNPAHPTAKTIRDLIVDQKKTCSIDDWVAQARKRQSSGDLFAALAWVAEGLAVHPDDPKLVQTQDAIQRDQGTRRRQARRGDLEALRRMEQEIDSAADLATKQRIAERIQAVAAKYWTDGEILSVANSLLQRLGLAPQESSTTSNHTQGATVIFHVPRPSTGEGAFAAAPPVAPNPASPRPAPPSQIPIKPVSTQTIPDGVVPPSAIQAKIAAPGKAATASTETRVPAPPAVSPAAQPSTVALVTSSISLRREPPRSKSTTVALVVGAAIILVAATFYFTRRHYAPSVAKMRGATPRVSAPAVSSELAPPPAIAAPAEATPQPSSPASSVSSDSPPEKIAVDDHQMSSEPSHNLGTLLIIAGQSDAKVFLNGKLQRQLTQSGQLRLLSLEPKDYVVQVSKSGFQDPPGQSIRVRKGEEAQLIFNLQPMPRLASLMIQGGIPGSAVLIDQTPVGTLQADGTLSVSTINPGDHTVELRKDRFKPRQMKRNFVAGGTVSLAAVDAALEALPGQLTITFVPADAKVAVVKGELLKIVGSGVPLSLPPGTYTLTARTADRFTRSSTIEVVAGQPKTLELSLGPSGMSKWDDPVAWKQEKNSFIHKGGNFVLYGAVPASGTFLFSAMPAKGRLLQWVLDYADPRNYVLFQMDDNFFYRAVIRNGTRTDEVKVPDKGDKKSFRTLQIRVGPTEIVHQIKHGDSWTVVDRWTQPGANLGLGKFGFYIPGNDEVALSGFAHYGELNLR